MSPQKKHPSRTPDYRTLLVAAVIHGGLISWSLQFNSLPLWISAPLGSVLLAWYGSLQHETIHGHPTASSWLNALIGGLPLSLWVPYSVYRETHLEHHRHTGHRLTEVEHDPESFYLPPGYLASIGRLRRAILIANCTLAGRLLIGPAIAIVTFWACEVRRVRDDHRHLLVWAQHAIGLGIVLAWVVGVCKVPFHIYLLCVVYPSIAITHVRSFAEHSADSGSHLRTNVVEAHPLWSLLFLNNNLHVAHHLNPARPWHELPQIWSTMRPEAVRGGRVFKGGYWEVAGRYLFRPFITPEHPASEVRP
jgi:fatty acid desaturase